MKPVETTYYLHKIRQRYFWIRGTEILFWAVAAGLVSFYVARLFLMPPLYLTIALLATGITAVAGIRLSRMFKISERELALYLNRNYGALKDSADLMLKVDEELSPLQRLQKIKTTETLAKIYPTIKIPHHIGKAVCTFVAAAALSGPLSSFKAKTFGTTELVELSGDTSHVANNLPVKIKKVIITISPPAYTKINKLTRDDFNLRVEEGSIVEWEVTFEGQVLLTQIVLSGRDSLPMIKHDDTFQVKSTFVNSGFYQLAWMKADSAIQYSDYYKIDVVKDEPPSIVVEDLHQFIEIQPEDNSKVNLKATLSDDYGLQNASIIATVSKGTGEAVKFREERLVFDAPKQISGNKVRATKLIDLLKLGLEPGDELYFYIEASDIKRPSPNLARTHTFFIALLDTAALETSVDGSLGVDLMPEYFRSQRQIIIDTEKLLKERKNISSKNFNERSNSLAHDQKMLRMRYGEFLGEEFESNIGPSDHSEELKTDITEKFGHSHDTENEHNLVEEKSEDKEHIHSTDEKKDDPLKEFVHAHDSDEEATFFVQSIKAKLKAAITIMWDAELHLRLYQPAKSLPYQYKALKLLKEISQDSRIYVHRTGFDPPPLKEDKRLTGDLSEIGNSIAKNQARADVSYPNIRKAITLLEKLLQGDSLTLSADELNILTNAGRELAELELKKPGGHLKILSLLKMITQGEGNIGEQKEALHTIRISFSKVLPNQVRNPQAASATTHDLDLEFLKSLEAAKQKNLYDH